MTDFEVKKKTTYEVNSKGETGKDLEDAGEKINAAGKAVANKAEDAGKELNEEYRKERIKEKLD